MWDSCASVLEQDKPSVCRLRRVVVLISGDEELVLLREVFGFLVNAELFLGIHLNGVSVDPLHIQLVGIHTSGMRFV